MPLLLLGVADICKEIRIDAFEPGVVIVHQDLKLLHAQETGVLDIDPPEQPAQNIDDMVMLAVVGQVFVLEEFLQEVFVVGQGMACHEFGHPPGLLEGAHLVEVGIKLLHDRRIAAYEHLVQLQFQQDMGNEKLALDVLCGESLFQKAAQIRCFLGKPWAGMEDAVHEKMTFEPGYIIVGFFGKQGQVPHLAGFDAQAGVVDG